jgi:ornithine cyclodeaminase/alanine dehydrogenase-like protein (mu-crystallin family)
VSIPYFNASKIDRALPINRAVEVMEAGLLDGIDPEADSPRLFSPAPDGEFLIMPTNGSPTAGIKVSTIAPNNPSKGLERIQGVYLLFDSESLAPIAVMDGAHLTLIRTPAATLTGVSKLVAADQRIPVQPRVLIYGAGPQAYAHILGVRALYNEAPIYVRGRSHTRTNALVSRLDNVGIQVTDGHRESLAEFDIIICVTSSKKPLFDGRHVADHTVIASVGQHGLDAREVDKDLVLRSDIFVEGRESSWRESGNLAQARSFDSWRDLRPPNIRDLVQGDFFRNYDRPALYTGVGMAWQDLVLARAVFESHQ